MLQQQLSSANGWRGVFNHDPLSSNMGTLPWISWTIRNGPNWNVYRETCLTFHVSTASAYVILCPGTATANTRLLRRAATAVWSFSDRITYILYSCVLTTAWLALEVWTLSKNEFPVWIRKRPAHGHSHGRNRADGATNWGQTPWAHWMFW